VPLKNHLQFAPSAASENGAYVVAPLSRVEDGAVNRVKLLLVDDDRDNLLALHAVLEPLDQELMIASSGSDALRLCLEHDFAAILLDVRMPEIDGFETAELIRARKKSSHTPILFLTGYRSDEQLFRGYDLGAVDFLFKPIVPEVLQSKVAVFVELSRSEQMLRRQAEALARTEQRFRAVLEAAPDAMVITGTDGIIRLANSRTDATFGYRRHELIGLSITSLIPQWTPPEIHQLDSGDQTRPFPETRLEARCQDGTSFPIEITRNPFENEEGVLITTAIRDATEKVQAEERLSRINAELERRVAERTMDLTRSNDALRQFAWAASHDLQEPIRMVISYAQWLKRSAGQKLTPEETGMLDCVQQNGARLQALLSDLRHYIFLSESEQPSAAPVDCNVVLNTVKTYLEAAIQETGATIEAETLPKVNSVEILLVQLFQNLISNSLRYRSEKAPIIRIGVEPSSSEWIFSVRDNGIGIDPSQSEYIFGVFRRLHGRQYPGTGIGLAICKAAAERLGGRIWVEAQGPPGATFKFAIPRE
jgi:PAS domain S-box-containing protein